MPRQGGGRSPEGARELKELPLAQKVLRQIPAQGQPEQILDALRNCIPVASGLLGVVRPGAGSGLTSRAIRLPSELFEAWMSTPDAYLTKAFVPLFKAREGDFWSDGEALAGPLREQLAVMQELDRYGLGQGAGYKVLERRGFGEGTEHMLLALLTERGDRFPAHSRKVLKALQPAIREAVLRLQLPLVPSRSILGQVVEEQSIGYICLSMNGSIVEFNRPAFELVSRYREILGLRDRRPMLVDFAKLVLGGGGRTTVFHGDGRTLLDVWCHTLVKEKHMLSEDVILVELKEIKLPEPASSCGINDVFAKLTPRRREIAMELVETDLPYKQIASKLGISTGTMRKHAENIYRALRVSSRPELSVLARKRSGSGRS